MRGLHQVTAIWAAIAICGWCLRVPAEEDTLPPLAPGYVPQTLDEIWSGFDPRQEPLEPETLKEWEQQGAVCRIVRFRVGQFKGQKSRVAGIYAFPKGGSQLPALIQMHGGGQSANLNAALTNAQRGYACLSLNWGGNPLNDGSYKPLWENAGTDWGATDGTHPPQKDPINHFASLAPNEFTQDAVESPRNSAWLLVAMAARRGLTFLEQQPEVDAAKLGIYGHSMGAKLTVMVAASDSRVRCAVPSCGGISDYPSERWLENTTLLKRLNCPILFLNPVNDFYGRIDDLPQVPALLSGQPYRFSCAPNLNHRDGPEHFACGPLWFDAHLRGTFQMPQSPEIRVELQTASGIPQAIVRPDTSRAIQTLNVFYTQLARTDTVDNPCWRYAPTTFTDGAWQADLPVGSLNAALRVYADVHYALEQPVVGAGYYYAPYTAHAFALSSTMVTITPEALQAGKVQVRDEPSFIIELFEPGWQHGWYVYSEGGEWPYRTNKIQDPKWQAPPEARLVLQLRSQQPNKLVIQVDRHAAEFTLQGGEDWQTISLASSDLHNAQGEPLAGWAGAQEIVLGDQLTLTQDGHTKTLGQVWQGPLPEFQRLRWEPKAD